jgi:hypothetical protein
LNLKFLNDEAAATDMNFKFTALEIHLPSRLRKSDTR